MALPAFKPDRTDDIRDNQVPGGLTDRFAVDLALAPDEARWNQTFPYQLVVLRAQGENQYAYEPRWRFTLPCPPEALSIITPFAINTFITQDGVVEQHGGAPIRMISMEGTTGLYPLRGSADSGSTLATTANAIFGGTIRAARSVGSNAVAAVRGQLPGQLERAIKKGTGYYHFHLLSKFLESYAAVKRTADGRDLRLALLIWKDRHAYIMTPQTFTLKRHSQRPAEYLYSFQGLAWKRINPEDISGARFGGPFKRGTNLLSQTLNRVRSARHAMAGVSQAARAVGQDVNALAGEVLREAALFVKEAKGMAATLSEMPNAVVEGLTDTLAAGWDDLSAAIDGDGPSEMSGQMADYIAAQRSGVSAASQATSPIHRAFKDPQSNFDFFDQISLDQVNPPPPIRQKILDERERVRQFTRRDLEERRDKLLAWAADYANKIGLGDPVVNAIYGYPDVQPLRTPSEDDYVLLEAMNDAVIQLGRLAAYKDVNPTHTPLASLEAIASLASASGVGFRMPTSKFAVPVPYGFTIEQIAARYLKDANRWHEIAALNDLRSPFIDEIGFDLVLATDAHDNVVTVTDVSNLYLGQPVVIYAPSVGQTARTIDAIFQVGSYWAVQLSGLWDLDSYTVAAGAQLHAYLPGTTNSQRLIYIPSDRAPSHSDLTKQVPGLNPNEYLLDVAGVDMLLTPDGDLAITPDGDCRLAVGMTNLVQQVRIALATPRGALVQHPEYGLEIQVGASQADFTAQELLSAVKSMFQSDPAYSGVLAASVVKDGPAVQLSIEVGVAGSDTTIPVTVDVR